MPCAATIPYICPVRGKRITQSAIVVQCRRTLILWFVAICVVGGIAHSFGIQEVPYGEYVFRKAQTSLLIQQFVEQGFDVRSPLPVLGPPYFVPFEFPLFQWISALAVAVTGLTPTQSAGLLSLILFELSALIFGVLLTRWCGAPIAVCSLVLAQLVPFSWSWASAPLIEFMPVAASLGSLLLLDIWLARRWPLALLGAMIFQVTSFMVKPTTGIVLLPLLIVPFLRVTPTLSRGSLIRAGGLVAPTALGVIAAWFWTRFADSVKSASPFTSWLTSANLVEWNFGSISQRLSPQSFLALNEHWAPLTGTILSLVIAATVGLYFRGNRIAVVAFVLCPLFAWAIFTNLFVVHSYYAIAIMFPSLALLSVAVITVSSLPRDAFQRAVLFCGSLAVLFWLAWTSNEGAPAAYFFVKGTNPALSQEIKDSVPRSEGVIVVGCDWNPYILYGAERRGLMIVPEHSAPIPAQWIPSELSYVAFCGSSRDTPRLPPGARLNSISPNVSKIVLPEYG